MKAYIATSGTIFALILVAHGLRVFAEGWRMVAEPFFLVTTIIAAALSVWAVRLLRVAVR